MRFWNLIPDPETPGDGVLDIEGPIAEESWFGDECSSKEFVKALKDVGNVTVHINSPGGDVMAGAEIYSALREHSLNGRGRVTVIVTALAASAASVVAMAGDEILMSPVAYMMIHNPWTVAAGNAQELRKQADVLDVISEGLINAYERRTGKSRDEIAAMLSTDTYMSAQTCIDEGFADGMMWETPQQPADPAARQTAAKMQSRNYNRQAVMAMLQAHGAAPKEDPQAAQEAARRAEIAKRASIVAGLF